MTRMMKPRGEYDAIVVGARVAGAATAMLLARAGARVLMIDKGAYGTDTLSTHALMRTSVLLLQRWGVMPAILAAGTPPVHHTAFTYDRDRVDVPIKADGEVDALYAPRRTVLDRAMVDAARSEGVEIAFGTTLEALTQDETGRVRGIVARTATGQPIRAGAEIVIGADGRQSLVARLAKAEVLAERRERGAMVFGYIGGIENRGYRWSYRPGSSIGAIPTNDGHHCVFVSVPREGFWTTFRDGEWQGLAETVKAHDPDLAAQLAPEKLDGGLRRFGGATAHLRQAFGPGWALVGDAAYFKDPLTAHGITDAFRDAGFLAEALGKGTTAALSAYQALRNRLSAPLFEVTAEIASFRWDMDRLKDLHSRLNHAMKIEHMRVANPIPAFQSVA